jgi:hypothetical protein
VDIRQGKAAKLAGLMQIAAKIIGVNYDELRQRNRERGIRRFRFILAVTTTLVVVFAFLLSMLLIEKEDKIKARRVFPKPKPGRLLPRKRKP